jgi:transcriptional regulator with XRE-family HTH domain
MVVYSEVLLALAGRARALRLLRNLSQKEVAERAGVGVMTVHRFEKRGHASIENVLRIAVALGAEGGLDALFELPKYRSLDEALARPKAGERKRVWRRK